MADLLLLGELITCAAMLGIIWNVQLSTYPLFAKVDPVTFADYHHGYTSSVTWVILPLMLGELACNLGYLFLHQGSILAWVRSALLGVIWASTFFIQVPLHNQLGLGHDKSAIARLVRTNWLRTAAWTLRTGLLAYSLAR